MPADDVGRSGGSVRGVRRPRQVRYPAFILTGAAIGALAAVVVTLTGSLRGEYATTTVLAYLAALFALLGALLGGAVAVVVEAVLRRRPG